MRREVPHSEFDRFFSDNPYEILGVAPGYTKADLDEAKRNLLMEHHTDINDNDRMSEEVSRKINGAYDELVKRLGGQPAPVAENGSAEKGPSEPSQEHLWPPPAELEQTEIGILKGTEAQLSGLSSLILMNKNRITDEDLARFETRITAAEKRLPYIGGVFRGVADKAIKDVRAEFDKLRTVGSRTLDSGPKGRPSSKQDIQMAQAAERIDISRRIRVLSGAISEEYFRRFKRHL